MHRFVIVTPNDTYYGNPFKANDKDHKTMNELFKQTEDSIKNGDTFSMVVNVDNNEVLINGKYVVAFWIEEMK